MKIGDYLLLRTPAARMGEATDETKLPEAGKVPGSRIAISILGIILGIVASFYVTGISGSADAQKRGGDSPAVQAAAGQTESTSKPANPASKIEPQVGPFTWARFWPIGLISLVVCGLSYQGLYFSLRLYQREPTFLILFVSFQYGYFWQSALKGASALLK